MFEILDSLPVSYDCFRETLVENNLEGRQIKENITYIPFLEYRDVVFVDCQVHLATDQQYLASCLSFCKNE